MMKSCPECNSRIYEYEDDIWLEWICWKCGYYKSNTPAFKTCPSLFKDLVRDNPVKFLKKYAHYGSPTRNQHDFKHGEDSTEPFFLIPRIMRNSLVVLHPWSGIVWGTC
jgi:DNA-directed RNA polymerase subunit M/transcription elongation factor TFIIS